jgi:hypothetical protein
MHTQNLPREFSLNAALRGFLATKIAGIAYYIVTIFALCRTPKP